MEPEPNDQSGTFSTVRQHSSLTVFPFVAVGDYFGRPVYDYEMPDGFDWDYWLHYAQTNQVSLSCIWFSQHAWEQRWTTHPDQADGTYEDGPEDDL